MIVYLWLYLTTTTIAICIFWVFATGWWFGTWFLFFHIWDNPSHWLKFSDGLKPPTSFGIYNVCVIWYIYWYMYIYYLKYLIVKYIQLISFDIDPVGSKRYRLRSTYPFPRARGVIPVYPQHMALQVEKMVINHEFSG